MKSLSGKKVIITGAGSGIGRSLAYQLSGLGAQVFLTDVSQQTLDETCSNIQAKGGTWKSYLVDSGNEKAIFDFRDAFIKEEQHVDVLINNAGMALGEIKFTDVKDEHLKHIFNVNLWGVVNFTRAFLPNLLTRPEASVVNLSSVFGLVGVHTQVPYCTTKFAVRGFSESLRMELSGTNVTVTCVHPGGIKTNIARNGIHYTSADKSIARLDKAAITSADDAAKTIINGIRNKKSKVLIGRDAWFIDRVARLIPVRYTRLFLWLEKKMFL
ncbi:MAG TPA: SDR family NAD(P)-dependent oxidoreductase [Chitinophagales bacterium]|nr:SDR family NAD(P)-dependent oxidoreductase [Chitinophagales bacterium]